MKAKNHSSGHGVLEARYLTRPHKSTCKQTASQLYDKFAKNGNKFVFDKWLKKHPKDLPPGSGSSSSSGKGGSSSGSKGGRKVVCRRDDTGVQAQVCEVSDSGDQNNATNWGTSKDTHNGTYYLPDEGPKLWNSTLQSAAPGSGGVAQPTGTARADPGSQKRSEIGKRALTTNQLIRIVTNAQSNVPWNGIKVRNGCPAIQAALSALVSYVDVRLWSYGATGPPWWLTFRKPVRTLKRISAGGLLQICPFSFSKQSFRIKRTLMPTSLRTPISGYERCTMRTISLEVKRKP